MFEALGTFGLGYLRVPSGTFGSIVCFFEHSPPHALAHCVSPLHIWGVLAGHAQLLRWLFQGGRRTSHDFTLPTARLPLLPPVVLIVALGPRRVKCPCAKMSTQYLCASDAYCPSAQYCAYPAHTRPLSCVGRGVEQWEDVSRWVLNSEDSKRAGIVGKWKIIGCAQVHQTARPTHIVCLCALLGHDDGPPSRATPGDTQRVHHQGQRQSRIHATLWYPPAPATRPMM